MWNVYAVVESRMSTNAGCVVVGGFVGVVRMCMLS
jgi:hypothetical protein